MKPATPSTALASFDFLDLYQKHVYHLRVYAIGNHPEIPNQFEILEMAYDPDSWAGEVIPVSTVRDDSPLTGCMIDWGPQQRYLVHTIGRDRRIGELAWTLPGAKWRYFDITGKLNGPLAGSATGPIACYGDNTAHVYFIDERGNLQQLLSRGEGYGWKITNVSERIHLSFPRAKQLACLGIGGIWSFVYVPYLRRPSEEEGAQYDIVEAVYSPYGDSWETSLITLQKPIAENSSLVSCYTSQGIRLYYATAEGGIFEVRQNTSGWYSESIKNSASAEPGSLAGCVLDRGVPRLYYVSKSGGPNQPCWMHELAGE